MFGRNKNTTDNDQASTVETQFIWRDRFGARRTSNLTGFMDYTGRSMPRGQYLQADSGRWVHQSQFVGWAVAQ